jgi:hypothetical protein
MDRPARRPLTMLDAMLLVGSAAIGFGVYQAVWRGIFLSRGWYFLMVQDGFFGPREWTASRVVGYSSDILALFIPVAAAWTILLPLLRMRPTRIPWRRAWRQPGMSACLAALFGWGWAIVALAIVHGLAVVVGPNRRGAFDLWLLKFFSEEVFMYVGLAVAAIWTFQLAVGRWRRPVDSIDRLGRIVGVIWLAVGMVWSLREYLEF